ncbi:MAG: ADP-ribosylglycohydrolase family protein [Oscillospiraceae bacterium]|nr:ADP-ribosylglycohydrolase family protein [Oscillospiraceae bacterium]
MWGAVCGDILGSGYEFEEIKYPQPEKIRLMNEGDFFTDDSAMTFAVMEWLLVDIHTRRYKDEELKRCLAKRMVHLACVRFKDRSLGFGGRFWEWCCRAAVEGRYDPINSFGNGAGMRVSPVGWFFDTLEETLRFAKLSADVTHDHPEGQKGAMCISAAVYLARKGKTKQEIREYLLRAFGYADLNETVPALRAKYGWSEICQDTVPQAVVAFLDSTDYESAIRLAISYGSDADTIAAMTGAIAEAYYGGVPAQLLAFCRARLPEDMQELCSIFAEAVRC